eukprot:2419085-Rhodomonas_salina.1
MHARQTSALLDVFGVDNSVFQNPIVRAGLGAAAIPAAVYVGKRVYDAVAYFPFAGPRAGPWGISVKGGLPGLEDVYTQHCGEDNMPVCFRCAQHALKRICRCVSRLLLQPRKCRSRLVLDLICAARMPSGRGRG